MPWKDPSSNAFFSWLYIILFGLMSQSLGSVFHTSLAVSGISGAMGVVALNYYWKKISGDSNDKS